MHKLFKPLIKTVLESFIRFVVLTANGMISRWKCLLSQESHYYNAHHYWKYSSLFKFVGRSVGLSWFSKDWGQLIKQQHQIVNFIIDYSRSKNFQINEQSIRWIFELVNLRYSHFGGWCLILAITARLFDANHLHNNPTPFILSVHNFLTSNS